MFPLGPVIYFRSQACFTPSEPARPLADVAAVPVAVMKRTIFEKSHYSVQPSPAPPRSAPPR